jgi:Ca2+-transporting ATPase
MKDVYQLPKEQVLKELNTDFSTGLSNDEAKQRLLKYGSNELIEKGKKSAIAILFAQIRELMVIILLVAAIVSIFLHEYIDAGVILVIVILNTAIGFWQEYKAENAMAALKKLAVPKVRVRRNGIQVEVLSKDLVPGDILFVEAGNIVPADARLIRAVKLKVQESTLTGESVPVGKNEEALSGTDIPLGDRKNMIYSGTVVTYGRGQAVVTHTGMNTELGKIAAMLQDVEDEQTPLQIRLDKLGKMLAGLAVLLILVVAGMTLLRGLGLKDTFMIAISMAVAAIPEGLPAVVTIALALGAQRMLKKNSLIRHLPAVESLGSVTVICSDKTGTLTQNKMTVTDIVLPGQRLSFDEIVTHKNNNASIGLLLISGALCNDAVIEGNPVDGNHGIIGDPTEGALVIAAEKIGIEKSEIEKILPRATELPFDSNRKRMTTIHQIENRGEDRIKQIIDLVSPDGDSKYIAFTKGSLDGLVDVCTHVVMNGKRKKMTEQSRNEILEQNGKMAEQGIRVLGSAYKMIAEDQLNKTNEYETGLTYIGMFGMIDPVRPEAIEAVRLCQKAGIRVVMITGDHPLTAKAIARELGIVQNGRFLTGKELSKMTVAELKNQIDEVSVYARVSPENKMVIIDALQEKNQIVSMTGDGVNDAPALKSADIGVAMGITGTDVARESSDMVLLDDNFATIVAAVKEGRTIFDNIRKFVKYILTGNAGEIFVMLTGPILGMPIPLLPIQILWINLVTDGAPAIALGYEQAEKNIMKRPPFQPDEGVFSRGVGRQILTMGMLIGLISIAIGFWFWQLNPVSRSWQTMVFTILTFCQMTYALCVRKNHQSLFTNSLFSNRAMFLAVGLTFAFQLMLIYVPFLNTIFRTVPLSGFELVVCLIASMIVIVVTEIEKMVLRRGRGMALSYS